MTAQLTKWNFVKAISKDSMIGCSMKIFRQTETLKASMTEPKSFTSYVREIEDSGYSVTLKRVASPIQKVRIQVKANLEILAKKQAELELIKRIYIEGLKYISKLRF